jgi:solute carrier family 35 protein C2
MRRQYNKWMFNDEQGKQKIVFPFPLFTTCVHMLVQFSLATLVLYLVPRLRPSHDFVNPHAPANVRHEPRDPSEPIMTRWFYTSRIGPCGIATGLDIGLGNMSFVR